MREKVKKAISGICVIIGFFTFIAIVGTAGAIDQNSIDLKSGTIRMIVLIAIFGVFSMVGSGLSGETEDDEFGNL